MEQVKANEEFISKVVDEINKLRHNPQSYAEKVRKYATYFKGKILKIPELIPIMTSEGAEAFEEAAHYLDSLNALPALKFSSGLTHVANEALSDIQKLEDVDKLNDLSVDEYIDKHGEVVGHFAQAVDFGSSLPELVVINLLVDDGDSSRGNRANLVDTKYKLVGVSTGNHAVYHNCTVLMYARHFFGKNEKYEELSDDNYEDEDKKKKNEIKEIQQKLNVVRRTSVNKDPNVSDVQKSLAKANIGSSQQKQDDDFDLPEGVVKIEKKSKVIVESGVKKVVTTITTHKEDGSTDVEVTKEVMK